jgi:phospholipase/carboxylesterase
MTFNDHQDKSASQRQFLNVIARGHRRLAPVRALVGHPFRRESSLGVGKLTIRNFLQGSFGRLGHSPGEMLARADLPRDSISRRRAMAMLGGHLAGLALWDPFRAVGQSRSPRLTARPAVPNAASTTGMVNVSTSDLTAAVYVPTTCKRDKVAPMVVFLHGALRTVDFFMDGFKPAAERSGVILLAPYSTQGTWDAIRGTFGHDVAILDAALRWVFERWTIDPARMVLSGFSDGGTYSLAVGCANGYLFSRVVAYSPGFLIPIESFGRPAILITHGRQDTILPIDSTSRVIVPELRRSGYDVDYREFDGPHAVPLPVANEVMIKLGAAHG